MITVSLVLAALVAAWFLAYHRANGLAWSLALAGGVLGLTIFTGTPLAVITALWIALGVFAALSIVKVLRRAIVSGPIFGIYKKILPQISQTEQEALDAGSIWWDADLFSGKPDWTKMFSYPLAKLSAEEQAFLDGPVAGLCGMLDEWDITHNRMDLPPEVWKFIREKGFLGIIIPKSYGGLGFSPLAPSGGATEISPRRGTGAGAGMGPHSPGPRRAGLPQR